MSDTGAYTCLITNDLVPGLELHWKEATLKVQAEKQKHVGYVFTPNNDGTDDYLYIPAQGTTNIYNRSGIHVKQLATPGDWDGTDASGAPLPMGAYLLRTPSYKDRMVTLIR